MTHGERGSIVPLILGFFLLALLVVAGAVALGEAFVQQRDLQSACDAAAAAAAADAADIDRTTPVGRDEYLRFGDVRAALAAYLARDSDRREMRVSPRLSPDGTAVTLTCERTDSLPMGALVGHPRIRHRVTSTSRAAVLG